VVVSVSPQSRASLSGYFDLTQEETLGKLMTVMKELGVSYVFDTSFSREVSLLQCAKEFMRRKENNDEEFPLPMLISSCPGWVCYAEKTQSDFVLPYLSTTKSPQQIMGAIVKYYFPETIGKQAQDIFHVTVMPCYDKKLEAVRNDFYDEEIDVHEVDCVLVTSDLLTLFKEKSIDFNTVVPSVIDNLYTNVDEDGKLFGVNGVSGGYSDFIFRYVAKELYNMDNVELTYNKTRNNDIKEVNLEVDGKKILSFCTAYGFRNIRNIVTQIKLKKCKYDLIEVMACPGGCTFGAGQIQKEMKIDEIYKSIKEVYPGTQKQINDLLELWIGEDKEKEKKILSNSVPQTSNRSIKSKFFKS